MAWGQQGVSNALAYLESKKQQCLKQMETAAEHDNHGWFKDTFNNSESRLEYCSSAQDLKYKDPDKLKSLQWPMLVKYYSAQMCRKVYIQLKGPYLPPFDLGHQSNLICHTETLNKKDINDLVACLLDKSSWWEDKEEYEGLADGVNVAGTQTGRYMKCTKAKSIFCLRELIEMVVAYKPESYDVVLFDDPEGRSLFAQHGSSADRVFVLPGVEAQIGVKDHAQAYFGPPAECFYEYGKGGCIFLDNRWSAADIHKDKCDKATR